jgi:hypothetical protein
VHYDGAVKGLQEQVIIRGAEPHPVHVLAEGGQCLLMADLPSIHPRLQRLGKSCRRNGDRRSLSIRSSSIRCRIRVPAAPMAMTRASADRPTSKVNSVRRRWLRTFIALCCRSGGCDWLTKNNEEFVNLPDDFGSRLARQRRPAWRIPPFA